jgi:hypothetical protein
MMIVQESANTGCLLLLILLFFLGCSKPLERVTASALGSTNVVFKPNTGKNILLTPKQSQQIKHIIGRFKEVSQVRKLKEFLPYESGAFIANSIHFGWFGNQLYFHDRDSNLYFVVEDPVLERLNNAFFAVQGKQPPLRYPSEDEWREILQNLE